jgi:hypothetical protein
MKRLETLIILAALFGVSVYAGAVSVERYQSGDTAIYNLDDSGNVTVAGYQTVAGSSTLNGATGITGATALTGAVTVTGALTQASGAVTLSTTSYNGGVVLYNQTKAQINALLPTTTGQMVLCNDCTRSAVCVSSGSNSATSVGAWVIAVNTGTFAGSTFSGFAHCQ